MDEFEAKQDKNLFGHDVEVETVTMTNEERALHPDLKDTSRRDTNPAPLDPRQGLGALAYTMSSMQAV